MKLFTSLLGAAVTAVALSGSAIAQDVTLRLHQLLPPQAAIPSKGLIPWAERIEAASDGRIKIEHYPAMQLGGAPPSLFGQAQDGVVDIIWTVLGYTPVESASDTAGTGMPIGSAPRLISISLMIRDPPRIFIPCKSSRLLIGSFE